MAQTYSCVGPLTHQLILTFENKRDFHEKKSADVTTVVEVRVEYKPRIPLEIILRCDVVSSF